jgi:hypothetical protein
MAAKRFENPLLSDARLKQMYLAMVETRALSERLRAERGGRHKGFVSGLEACWVGSAIGLQDGENDFACADELAGPALDVVLGTTARAALRGARAASRLDGKELGPVERTWFALGGASRMPHGAVGIIFLGLTELDPAAWKRGLATALQAELPVVFVAIPAKGDEPGIAELSSRLGVPGIPVDANDAVAMYRVAQESIGRARAGGGPALIEAIRFPRSADPIELLKRQLVAKKVATQHWVDAQQHRLQSRTDALKG